MSKPHFLVSECLESVECSHVIGDGNPVIDHPTEIKSGRSEDVHANGRGFTDHARTEEIRDMMKVENKCKVCNRQVGKVWSCEAKGTRMCVRKSDGIGQKMGGEGKPKRNVVGLCGQCLCISGISNV